MNEESMTLEEWNERKPWGDNAPVIMPVFWADMYEEQFTKEKSDDLRAGKVVYIQGYWCMCSRRVEAKS